MATRTATRVTTAFPPTGSRIAPVAKTGVYSVVAGTSLSAGDVIQMLKVPQGAQVIYLALTGGSGDALITVGDSQGSTARYISSVTQSSAQPTIRTINTASAPYTYSIDSTIDITVGTVSVGTITGGFNLQAIWTLDAGAGGS